MFDKRFGQYILLYFRYPLSLNPSDQSQEEMKMKKLKEQLKAITKTLKDLGKQVDKAAARLEKLEKGR